MARHAPELVAGMDRNTHPPWLLPENSWSMLITPLANAMLYGLIALLISAGIRALKMRRS